jgi:Ni/Fe-hydrogenase subunit HybB-like protein
MGFAFNRMNTAITGLEKYPTQLYFPSMIEIFIMLGITAVGFSAFSYIAEYLPVFKDAEEARIPHQPKACSGSREPVYVPIVRQDLKPT